MVKNILYVVTDGVLDDLARKSIIGAANVYKAGNPIIHIYSLDSIVPLSDPLFGSIPDNVRINQVNLSEKDLENVFPNIMTKKFSRETPDGNTMITHWENAKNHNQHLANFSDLAIFYFMYKFPEEEFLYMDSDILPMKPFQSGANFIVSKDTGFDGKDYICAGIIYVPEGYKEVKERWLTFLENDIVDKYHFNYAMMGPIAFDKFLGREPELLGFPLTVLESNVIFPISFKELHQAAKHAYEKGIPVVIDMDHDGPGLNIPRSAITTVLSKCEDDSKKKEIKLLLGLVNIEIGAQVIDFMFYPKGITGISYYDNL